MGHEVFLWDMAEPFTSRERLCAWLNETSCKQSVWLICFNFIGLSGETQFLSSQKEEETIWEEYGIPWLTILVDHPMYYRTQLLLWEKAGRTQMGRVACVDRGHVRFLEEFYPSYEGSFFLPLAGTALSKEVDLAQDISEGTRDIEVLFAGNYVALSDLMAHTSGMDEETKAYVFSMIEELIAHPSRSIDEVALEYLRRDFLDATREEILEMLWTLTFVDLYVRSYFRREIICALAEAGICVHIIGKDWEKAECKNPNNLILHGQLDSLGCLRLMRRARLSLNIMPWFKEGAHDRIFNGMLQQCVVLTDSSCYLDEFLLDGKNVGIFSLEDWEEIPRRIRELLADEKRACIIAREGYCLAKEGHTWTHRASTILEKLL